MNYYLEETVIADRHDNDLNFLLIGGLNILNDIRT